VLARSLLVIVPNGGGCSFLTGSNRRFTVATVLTVSDGSQVGGSNWMGLGWDVEATIRPSLLRRVPRLTLFSLRRQRDELSVISTGGSSSTKGIMRTFLATAARDLTP